MLARRRTFGLGAEFERKARSTFGRLGVDRRFGDMFQDRLDVLIGDDDGHMLSRRLDLGTNI